MIKLRRSISGKTALAGLVSAATATTLLVALTAFAGAPAASAPRSARVASLAQAKVRVPPPVSAALKTLTGTSFSRAFGVFTDTNWRRAVAMSAMEAYRQTTGDATYDYTFANAQLLDKPAAFFEDSYNDDTAWWGLALLQGYSITHNPHWLQDAEDIANYIGKTWNTNPMACFAGGIPWHRPGPDFGYTGAIQNGLFLELTAWLHNTIVENGGKDSGPNSYLNWAIREWNYLKRTGDFHTNDIPLPKKGGFAGPPVLKAYWVPNGTPDLPNLPANNALCGSTRYRVYTYNQGVLIAGLVQLYKATSNNLVYLQDAEHIATAVVRAPTTGDLLGALGRLADGNSPWIFTFAPGVLIEPQDVPAFSPTCCLGDGAAFKGIFIRDLRMLEDTIANPSTPRTANSGLQCTARYNDKSYGQCTTMYNAFFTRQACSIEADDTTNVSQFSLNPGGAVRQQEEFLGDHWTGPSEPYDTTTQVSAVEAFVAAVHLPGQPPGSFPDCHPARRSPGQPGQQSQHPRPGHTVQAVQRSDGSWHRIPDCRQEHYAGRFFHGRHEQFSRQGDQGQAD